MRERDSIWLMNTKRDTRPAIDYSLIAPELVGSNLSARHISYCNFPRFAITANYPSRETVRPRVYPLCDFVTRRTCETGRVCVRRSVKMAILCRMSTRDECNKGIPSPPARYLIIALIHLCSPSVFPLDPSVPSLSNSGTVFPGKQKCSTYLSFATSWMLRKY